MQTRPANRRTPPDRDQSTSRSHGDFLDSTEISLQIDLNTAIGELTRVEDKLIQVGQREQINRLTERPAISKGRASALQPTVRDEIDRELQQLCQLVKNQWEAKLTLLPFTNFFTGKTNM